MPPQIKVPYYPPEPPLLAAPGYTNVTFFGREGVDGLGNPMGDPGEYEAIFTLLPPGQAAEKIKNEDTDQIVEIADEKLPGDSHLVLCAPEDVRSPSDTTAQLRVDVGVNRLDSETGITEVTLVPNDSGRVSKVIVRTTAENFDSAESQTYFEAASLLSHLAFKLDIPLRIVHTHIKEVGTGHTRTGYVRQFGYRSVANLPEFAAGRNELVMDIKTGAYPALASIYREALSSDSPFYQFLCFYRIIDRVIKRLRPRWKTTLREHDVALPPYLKNEKVPSEGDLAERIPDEVRGKKFTTVYQDYLRPLRDGIGHVFLEDEKDTNSQERSTDELDFITKAYRYLPVAHHIARAMLEKDFCPGGLALFAFELQLRNTDRPTPSP